MYPPRILNAILVAVVKDVEIACAFARRNGSHLTDRRCVIPGTVNMKSRKRSAAC
jgi:hypothetical protein